MMVQMFRRRKHDISAGIMNLNCLLNDHVEHVGVVQVALLVNDVVPGPVGHQVGVAGGHEDEHNTDTLVRTQKAVVPGLNRIRR